jgi:3,4-dihydroxy 2-butanone 4-phosphate synthase/GTP cyclohydrolase II
MSVRLDSIERALEDIRAGRAVVVVDDENRENEGDIIFAASKATPELMAFTIRWSSGVICAPVTGELWTGWASR